MSKYLLLTAAVLLFKSFTLLAQYPNPSEERRWEVSFFGGFSTLGEDTFVVPVQGDGTRQVGLDFATGYVVGARVSEDRGEHFGAEFEYSFANQPGGFLNLRPDLPRFDLDQRVHKAAYSLLFYPLPFSERHSIRPFASVGVGASFYQLAGDTVDRGLERGLDLKQRWKVAFSYGGGVRIALDPAWGIRLDVRDHVTGVQDYGLPRTAAPGQAGFRPQGVFHNWQAAAGIYYRFNPR